MEMIDLYLVVLVVVLHGDVLFGAPYCSGGQGWRV